jgi:dienelactone hydrolase
VQISDVTIPTPTASAPGHELHGLLAVPDGEGPWPGVIMVHEVFGIEENMRAQVERMCSAGYNVLMPDLYSRGGMRRCLTATFRALNDGKGQAFDDVEAAKNFLATRSDCTGKFGVAGFCMGGGFALQLANQGYGASAVNYGMMPKDIEWWTHEHKALRTRERHYVFSEDLIALLRRVRVTEAQIAAAQQARLLNRGGARVIVTNAPQSMAPEEIRPDVLPPEKVGDKPKDPAKTKARR